MSAEWILYHNNRCSKSRAALAWLETQGIHAEVVCYLDTPPDAATLADMAAKLDLTDIRGMMRVKDERYRDLGLADADVSQAALLAALAEHPALLERPILVGKTRAAIGRPTENLAVLLAAEREKAV